MKDDYIKYKATENEIDIPNSARAWQLYGESGSEKAARSLTAALKKALRARFREDAIRIMRDAMLKQIEFGATDSEPSAVAEQCLTKGRGGDYSWSL